jgi:tripartite-type tricarboxylate transporter receptor subunit TctC
VLNRRSVISLLPAAALGLVPSAGGAQAFPSRPVRLIAPYPPGGGIDTVARLIAGPMAEVLGQSVVVENRAGAGGSIGAAAASQAPPDGHTLLLDASGHVINPLLIRDLPFDYARAFAPVSLVVTQPIIVVGNPNLPIRSLAQLLERLKQPSADLSYGSSGNGTGPHIAAESLLRQAGVRATHVPYRGAAPALQDVMAGNVAFAVVTAGSTVAVAREGKVIPLAILSPDRMVSLPHVPTAREGAIPGFVFQEWNGLFAPAGTPAAAIARLHQAAQHAVGQSAVSERLSTMGAVPVGSDPASFGSFLAAQRDTVASTVRATGITDG